MGARVSSASWATAHEVHFYPSETSLVDVLTGFLSDGIRSGQPLVVITTPSRRRAVEARLVQLHPEYRSREAESVWLDARDTLAGFMEGRMPSPELFHATLGNVFDRLMVSRSYLVVRAYGEMVDMLWKDGNPDGAIALEKLWNALANRYAFNLLCAYERAHFDDVDEKTGYHRVCAVHDRVWPSPPA